MPAMIGPETAPPVRLCAGNLERIAGPIAVPSYERRRAGGIVHIGVGGFHRAHLAAYLHDLLAKGATEWSITGSGVMPADARMAEVLAAQDGLYVLVEREGTEARGEVVGSIIDYVYAGDETATLLARLVEPATHIVSMTITESGYPVEHGRFVVSDALEVDSVADEPRMPFGVVVRALDARRRAGLPPFTVLSCDNLPGNGDVARIATLGAAALRSDDLAAWLHRHGAFPNAMVDRITPMTTDTDREFVQAAYGVIDDWPVTCEPFRQWVLEDTFSDGRPPFEEAGVLMTTDVAPYERMKLRLLNGSHSGLAYLAALAGLTYVDEALAQPAISRFMRRLMHDEVAPTVPPPPGIDLVAYQDELVKRFSNAAIGDRISRLCLDGSSKFATFLVPPLVEQIERDGPLRMLAVVFAGWCRYLHGRADDGSALELAADPFLGDAIAAARAADRDPGAFFSYHRTFGHRLERSERLITTFTEALRSLERVGALATLDEWTR
jgi:mannitol 2-dehydrogenase